MEKILHVLNGDATAYSFAEAGLPGELAIWREMLSEGPLLDATQPDTALWKLRENWLRAEFGDRRDETDTYQQKVVAEFDQIYQPNAYDQIILWFEHDLFCQINLVFLLARFSRAERGNTVLKQVSINQFDGISDFKGLGQLTGAQLASLYPQAEPLTDFELRLAARVWAAYAASDVVALNQIIAGDFGRLRFLREALQAHLSRLQVGANGLSMIENQLLNLVQAAPKTSRQIVGEWLSTDRIYGLGDWSIENYLTRLIDQEIIQEQDGKLVEGSH
ncbi:MULTISPECIES: DUF1835 domain-containing protein [unclassified Spirosoma]|uniref:DUF1835 domain-containing protein n=1 Tax=unclassified Spirosoma TaxID=2621999 RepID=UPI00095B6FEA|nr:MULTISPECIES: DUF1835 domain-containing protein [unclassified Spirosoma]MBN8822323.1 DUF1835 domain-containing protein [Spirosoma sp.]OJW72378.1 MAG: hypothetical protein BGO59_14645 [Spirosoma sp. 48-14]